MGDHFDEVICSLLKDTGINEALEGVACRRLTRKQSRAVVIFGGNEDDETDGNDPTLVPRRDFKHVTLHVMVSTSRCRRVALLRLSNVMLPPRRDHLVDEATQKEVSNIFRLSDLPAIDVNVRRAVDRVVPILILERDEEFFCVSVFVLRRLESVRGSGRRRGIILGLSIERGVTTVIVIIEGLEARSTKC